jgi:hypothetical protein
MQQMQNMHTTHKHHDLASNEGIDGGQEVEEASSAEPN